MPGGNWASMPIVEQLENDLGKPVIANNAVSLWAGLRLLKIQGRHSRLRPAAARPPSGLSARGVGAVSDLRSLAIELSWAWAGAPLS